MWLECFKESFAQPGARKHAVPHHSWGAKWRNCRVCRMMKGVFFERCRVVGMAMAPSSFSTLNCCVLVKICTLRRTDEGKVAPARRSVMKGSGSVAPARCSVTKGRGSVYVRSKSRRRA